MPEDLFERMPTHHANFLRDGVQLSALVVAALRQPFRIVRNDQERLDVVVPQVVVSGAAVAVLDFVRITQTHQGLTRDVDSPGRRCRHRKILSSNTAYAIVGKQSIEPGRPSWFVYVPFLRVASLTPEPNGNSVS